MLLTSEQIMYLLKLIEAKEGPGYSKDPEVQLVQTRLSLMLEAARRAGR